MPDRGLGVIALDCLVAHSKAHSGEIVGIALTAVVAGVLVAAAW